LDLVDLRFAAKDARRFVDVVKETFLVSDDITLTDSIEETSGSIPTRSRILLELRRFINRVKPAKNKVSSIILLFSGHGMHTESGFVFCCKDFESEIPSETGVRLDDIFSLLSDYSGRKVVLFDCCRSYYDKSAGTFHGRASLPQVTARISFSDSLIFSCRAGETSIEVGDLASGFGGIFIHELAGTMMSCKSAHYDIGAAYSDIKLSVSERAAELECRQTPAAFGADIADLVFFRK